MTNLVRAMLVLGLVLPVSGEEIRRVTVDGQTYSAITDAHVVSGGKVVILYNDSGTTVSPDKLSKAFLDSWGITAEALEKSKAEAARAAEAILNQAIAAGYFREVSGVIYDLRKAPAGWTRIVSARVVEMSDDGALVDLTPQKDKPSFAYVRHLPRGYTDNQSVSVTAKADGTFRYFVNGGMQHTVTAYDAGRPCQKNEIPPEMLEKGLASVALPEEARHHHGLEELPGGNEVRAVGSGFFVTKNGYLLTDYHVVKEANRVEIKVKDRTLKAEVVDSDAADDLALLKVAGTNFPALRLSGRTQANLGEPVFTIGFPNVDLQGIAPKYTDGKISSLAGMQDDPRQYQISVPVQPGNSGGPLCDRDGEVVGIVEARLNDLEMLRSEGVIPQDVNYAIKATRANGMLERLADAGSLPTSSPKPDNVVQSVEDAVAMVMIY